MHDGIAYTIADIDACRFWLWFLHKLSELRGKLRGCRFSIASIQEKKKAFPIFVEAKRSINSNGKKRGKVEELIITNY